MPGWEFAAYYQAARMGGGDFYDFFELPGEPGQLGIVIADVTDKGMPAALFMALSRTLIRTTALSGRSPGAALTRANQLILKDSQASTFVSTFYATLDTYGGKLTYANAGHNPPLWLQVATSELQELVARGVVLGVFYDLGLEECEISVAPGDLLVFYTDGVTEAIDADKQMFGEDGLRAAVTANSKVSAQEVLEAIVQAVNTFTGNTPQSDDITLFVVKRLDTMPPRGFEPLSPP